MPANLQRNFPATRINSDEDNGVRCLCSVFLFFIFLEMVLRLREFKDRQFKGFKGLFEKYRCSKAINIILDFFYFEMVLRLRDRQFKGFKGLFEKYRCSKAIYINLDFIYLKLNSVLLHICILSTI